MPLSDTERERIRGSRELITTLFQEYNGMLTATRQMIDSAPEIQLYQLALEPDFCLDEDYIPVLIEIIHGHLHWRISGYSSLRANTASVAEMTARMVSNAAASLARRAASAATAASHIAASSVAAAAHSAASSAAAAAYSAMDSARRRALPAAASFASYLLGRTPQYLMFAAPSAPQITDAYDLPSPPRLNPRGFNPMGVVPRLDPTLIYPSDISPADIPVSLDPRFMPRYTEGLPTPPNPSPLTSTSPSALSRAPLSDVTGAPSRPMRTAEGDELSRTLEDFEEIGFDTPPSPSRVPAIAKIVPPDPRLGLFNAIITYLFVAYNDEFRTQLMSVGFVKCIKAAIMLQRGNRQNVYAQLFLPPEIYEFIDRQYRGVTESAASGMLSLSAPNPASPRAASVMSGTFTAAAPGAPAFPRGGAALIPLSPTRTSRTARSKTTPSGTL